MFSCLTVFGGGVEDVVAARHAALAVHADAVGVGPAGGAVLHLLPQLVVHAAVAHLAEQLARVLVPD